MVITGVRGGAERGERRKKKREEEEGAPLVLGLAPPLVGVKSKFRNPYTATGWS